MTRDGARQEVVVTGVGAVCGTMATAGELFDALQRLESAIRVHPGLAASGLPNAACAHVSPALLEDLSRRFPVDAVLGEGHSSHVRPFSVPTLLALHAARQAREHSASSGSAPERTGVFVGSNKVTCTADDLLDMGRSLGPDGRPSIARLARLLAGRAGTAGAAGAAPPLHAPAAAVSRALGAAAGAVTSSDACAAGAIAIGQAYHRIRAGELDVAIAGGTEALCHLVPLLGFQLLGALCEQPSPQPHTLSRPFDRDRSGFLMGEGSGFLVLESAAHAQRRGATVLGRISGFAKQAEAWRITSSPADGSAYARCMQAALADAGLPPSAIDHVSAHGTSTPQNDRCESLAIQAVFGERCAELPVTANKSALGHCLAAGGALQAVLAVLSLRRQQLLPTLNFTQGDADTAALAIVQRPRATRLRHVLSNAFGFGGQNGVLVFSAA